MVVFLQKLKVEPVSNFTFEDTCELNKSLLGSCAALVLIILDLLLDKLQNLVLVRLILLVADIKSDLIRIKV